MEDECSHKVYRKYHGKLESQTDSWRKGLTELKIQRGIFQRVALSTLLFVIAMMSLNYNLGNARADTDFINRKKINHLTHLGDITLFTKNEKELEIQILAVGKYSECIGVEFGIEKCAIQLMKRGKLPVVERTELPNQEKNQNTQRKGNLKKKKLGNIRS